MGVPGASGFWLDVGKASTCRRIGDADEMLAGWTLNLPPGMARIAFQRLIAVGTIKFEFVGVHKLIAFTFIMRKPGAKSIWEIYLYF